MIDPDLERQLNKLYNQIETDILKIPYERKGFSNRSKLYLYLKSNYLTIEQAAKYVGMSKRRFAEYLGDSDYDCVDYFYPLSRWGRCVDVAFFSKETLDNEIVKGIIE